MTYLILALVVMTGVAVLLLAIPVLRRPAEDATDRREQNIQIAQSQMKQLEADRKQGLRSEEDYQQALQQLEATLARDLDSAELAAAISADNNGRWMAVLVLVMVPALAGMMYWQLGQPQIIELQAQQQEQQERAEAFAQANPDMTIDEMIDRVKAKLRADPEDAEGWFILGRTYMTMQRYEEASVAFARTYELVGEEAAVMLAYADSLAMVNNGRMDETAMGLIQRAQELSPNNPTALWLAGLVAEQQGDFDQARRHWKQLLPLMADDPEAVNEINQLIAALPGSDAPQFSLAEPEADEAGVAAGPRLRVHVALSPELQANTVASDSVFVYAKAQAGPPMPLAAQRLRVSDLPVELILDESMAMIPGMSLSAFDTVIVGARVSKSGQALTQPGDFLGELSGVSNQSNDLLSITIDQIVPES